MLATRLSLSSLWQKILIGGAAIIVLWIIYTKLLSTDQSSVALKEPHSIRVEVYYEVLCPDSRYFILHQLYPTWQKIGDIMEVHFKPFGKASYQQSPRGYTFKCQHGPAECQGNMVHACAIKYVAKPALLMEYVKCMMNDNYEPKTAGAKCAESLGIDWSVIDKCVDSREGQELLAMYGDDTHSLRPKISFVPTILLDGSQNGQKDILKNLRLQICRMYSGRSPENCMEVV